MVRHPKPVAAVLQRHDASGSDSVQAILHAAGGFQVSSRAVIPRQCSWNKPRQMAFHSPIKARPMIISASVCRSPPRQTGREGRSEFGETFGAIWYTTQNTIWCESPLPLFGSVGVEHTMTCIRKSKFTNWTKRFPTYGFRGRAGQ